MYKYYSALGILKKGTRELLFLFHNNRVYVNVGVFSLILSSVHFNFLLKAFFISFWRIWGILFKILTLTRERAFRLPKEKIRPRSFTSLISHEISEVVAVRWRQKKISKKGGACVDLLLLFMFVCFSFPKTNWIGFWRYVTAVVLVVKWTP